MARVGDSLNRVVDVQCEKVAADYEFQLVLRRFRWIAVSKPSNTCRGTTISYLVGAHGMSHFTTMTPSFLEGRVPCFR